MNLQALPENHRWAIAWELITVGILTKGLDSRLHVSVQILACLMNLSLDNLSIAEQECAAILQRQLIEMRRQEENESKNRKLKIGAGIAVGGGIAFLCGILVLPLLVPALAAGVALGAGAVLSVPVAGAALSAGILAAGTIALMASPLLPFLFGAAGAGLIGYKIAHLTEGISQFHFVRVPIQASTLRKLDVPGERFQLDFQNQHVTDLRTGKVYVSSTTALNK